MFTVIFLSRAARAIFDESKAFFDPFCESGQIAFCDWNESPKAISLAQAVPSLPEVIKGKPAWRAVVVDHAPAAEEEGRDRENPFDFTANLRFELNLEDSPHALVRLSHQLLGYPAMSARAFEPAITYRGVNGEREEAPPVEEEDRHDQLRKLRRTESDVRMEYRDVPYTASEVERHRQLTERYQMKEVHPSEVIFISSRSGLNEDARVQLMHLWRTESEQNTSRFVERNDYPAATRFAVYDLLNPQNSGYEQDELRFWLTVLTIAVNDLPPSAFQGDRLYRLGIEFSDASIAELLNAHMGRLTALREHIVSHLQRPERPPDTDLREVLKDEKVRVQFENLGGGEIGVATTGYGLTSDVPRREAAIWASDFDRVRAEADHFLRKPRRVLARAVYDARAQSRDYLDEGHVLSEIEREEIEEELVKRVRTLTEPATTAILDRERLSRMLERQNATVRTHIAERMRLRTVAIASALVLLVWIAAFVPYLLQAAGKGTDALLWSVFILASVVLVLTGIGLVVLLVMRRRLILLLRSVNSALRAFVNQVSEGAGVFAGYLSGLTTYQRARALLIGAGRLEEQERVRARRLNAWLLQADRTIEAEKAIMESLGRRVEVRRAPGAFALFDIDDDRQIEAFFRLENSDRQAAFNDSGQQISAPYDFVRKLIVEREQIFESTREAG